MEVEQEMNIDQCVDTIMDPSRSIQMGIKSHILIGREDWCSVDEGMGKKGTAWDDESKAVGLSLSRQKSGAGGALCSPGDAGVCGVTRGGVQGWAWGLRGCVGAWPWATSAKERATTTP